MKKFRAIVCLLIMSMLVSCSNQNGDNQTTATPTEAASSTTENNDDGNNSTPETTEAPKVTESASDTTESGSKEESANDTGSSAETTDIAAAPAPGIVSITKKDAVTGVINGSEEVATQTNKSGTSGYNVINVEFKNKDTDVSLKEGEIKTITFNGDTAVLDCPNAKVENIDGRTVVTIMAKGSYVLTGSCSNGQVVVDSDAEENVHLYLNGLDLTCEGSAAIYEKSCDKLIVTLVKSSVNNLSETGALNYENTEKEEPDAVLFAKDKCVINGDGELNVFSENGQGICSTDDLMIVSGDINVASASHGIKGKDSLIINSGNINVNSGEDGLKSSSSKENKGYVIVLGGNIKISSAQDGIQSEGEMQLTGGVISIYSGGGRTADSQSETSCKGIKAGRDIYINNCAINLNSSENTVQSDKNVIIDNACVDLSSGKKCITGVSVEINDGIVNIDSSKEGIEGKTVSVNGGFVVVYSKNDGISAVNNESKEDGTGVAVNVNGGVLYVNAVTDGLDSKGDITISGGTVMIDGAIVEDHNALVCKGTAVINGGNFVAVSSEGEVKGFNSSSSQKYMIVRFEETIKAGAEIKVVADDKNIISFTNAKNCNAAIISCGEFKSGETYSVTVDGTEKATAKVE